MKIGINATFLSEKPTGAGRFAIELFKNLSRINKDTIIFSPFIYDDMSLDSVHKVSEAMKGSRGGMGNLYRFLYLNSALPLICKLKKLDVLYCPICEFPFINLVPVVIHIHDLHIIYFPSEFGLATPRLKLALQIIKRSHCRIVVSSEFVKNELTVLGYVKNDRIDVVPLAYSSEIYKPLPQNMRKDFLVRYSLPERYILFVSTLFPYKNLKTLISAFFKIKDKIPHSLVVVGRKEFSEEPMRKDDRLLYMDYVPLNDLPFFYSFADVFVYPSLMEGFGIPPLEAMACATPVISSNRGSLPEVVGDAGILFDPEDANALSELILTVLNNEGLRRELIEKGLNHVKGFSWEKTAEGILRSCEKALKNR